MARDLGDFQTPPGLVSLVLECLGRQGYQCSRALEPTCGCGNFIQGLLSWSPPPREIVGLEIQPAYVQHAGELAKRAPSRVVIQQGDILDLNVAHGVQWQEKGPLLVVGNPPWVTNAELGSLGSANLPRKSNLKNAAGLDAVTGSANFDIAEYIWLKLLRELADQQPTIALLCKTSVARNVLEYAAARRLPIGSAAMWLVDAKQWFGAAVDACLFRVDVRSDQHRYQVQVYPDLTSSTPTSVLGVVNGRMVADMSTGMLLRQLDGTSPRIWRQGIKHDAAAIAELTVAASGTLINKHGELVDVEPDFVYPLLKSSDLGGTKRDKPKRAVIVPQKRLGGDTRLLARSAPRLWQYLLAHQDVFDQRKSSIYRTQPPFAYFGVGEYSFASYKVAISGMYKNPLFRAIGPVAGRPVMFDDTCYFLPCTSAREAAFLASLLNDPLCVRFIGSIAFWDSKRPITKKLLQRIDLRVLLQAVDRSALLARAAAELAKLCEQEPCAQQSTSDASSWPTSLDALLGRDYHSGIHEAQLALPSFSGTS